MKLRETIALIKNDLKAHGAKTLFSILKVYMFNASFRVLLNVRIGKYLSNHPTAAFRFLGYYYKYRLVTFRGCEISYKAVIGRNVKFPHPIGIVIGEGVVIKNGVKIWQNVTLGNHGKSKLKTSYPTIGENVKIFAGAIVFGGISIGQNAVIGANSVVNIDVPDNSVAVGAPAKIIA